MKLHQIITAIEKRMVRQGASQNAQRPYFAGYIDALWDAKLIDAEQRHGLFMQYADPDLCERLAKRLKAQ